MQCSEKKRAVGMFLGERARFADIPGKLKAEKMYKEQIQMQDIWWETGWLKSKVSGGKWIYELADKNAELFPIYCGEVKRLNQVLSIEDVYENYPQLRNIMVTMCDIPDATGRCDLDKEVILISSNASISTIYSVLLHEIQHFIQKIEGLPSGSSEALWKAVVESTENRKKQLRHWLDTHDPTTPQYCEVKYYDALYGEEVYKYRQYTNYCEMYANTAGEIMAYDTELRFRLSAEERKQHLPYLGGKMTLYCDQYNGLSSKEMDVSYLDDVMEKCPYILC